MRHGQRTPGRPPALTTNDTGVLVPIPIGAAVNPAGGYNPEDLDNAIKDLLKHLTAVQESEKLSVPLLVEALRLINEAVAESRRSGDPKQLFDKKLVLQAARFATMHEKIQKAAALTTKQFDQLTRLRVHLHDHGRDERPKDFRRLSDAELRRIVSQATEAP